MRETTGEGLEGVWERLRTNLADLGVDEQTIATAAAEGVDGIRRLLARYISFPGSRRYTPRKVYEKAGVDEGTANALWRAMGFPLVPDDEAAFTDADVEALALACRLFERAGMDEAIVLQQARSMGQAAARIAASHQDVITEILPADDPIRAAEEALALADEALPTLDHLLVYMYRRHLAAATEQRMLIGSTAEGSAAMTVGFADLSGFTAMSQNLEVRELAALIERFNAAAAGVVTEAGGRVIKTIGDEVMFSTLEPGPAASMAIELIDQVSGSDGVPQLKVGVATGEVIAREGDLFGAPINLASRLVKTARPDTVLVDAATKAALADDGRFRFSSIGHRRLKGFGPVRAYRLRREVPGSTSDRRR